MTINETNLQEIYALLRRDDCNILKISAPTGSGKSVNIPRYLAHKGNRAFVSIPTIVSVKSIYNYQLSSSNITDEFRSKIGMAANTKVEEKQYNDNSILVYATTGHILNLLLNAISKEKKIAFCKVLIIDEVHDQGSDTRLILNLFNYAAKSGMEIPKLIMMSATPVDFDFIPELSIKEYNVKEGRKYSIKLEYLDTMPIRENINTQIVSAIMNNLEVSGHILVFLPGVPEINKLSSILRPKLPSDQFIILHLYGTMKNTSSVHEPYRGKKKVILSTNVAESSITITDVGLVIDTGLQKLSVKPIVEGSTKLEVVYISKNSATQRMGRTGRTKSGKCIRLYTKEFYDNMPDNTDNEIDRLPLHRVCLRIMSHKLSPYSVLLSKYKERISESIRYFIDLELITDKQLNSRGILCNRSSFGFKNTLIVEESNIRAQMLVVMSMCEGMSSDLLYDIDDLPLRYIVDLWNTFTKIYFDDRDNMSDKVIMDFCSANNVNYYNFRDILALIESEARIFNINEDVIINYRDIEDELYETRYKTILKNGDYVINKAIDKKGVYKNMDIIVLNSFESGNTIIVNMFLPYGKNFSSSKKKTSSTQIKYGLGRYFIMSFIPTLTDEERTRMMSLIA